MTGVAQVDNAVSGSTSGASHATEARDVVLDLVVRRVRAAAMRRLAWLERLWGGGAPSDTWGLRLEPGDTVEAELRWQGSEEAQLFTSAVEVVDAELRNRSDSGRLRIHKVFALTAAEADVLDVCLAQAMDPSLRTMFERLEQPRRHGVVTLWQAMRLFGHSPWASLRPGSALACWGLVRESSRESRDGCVVAVDPRVLDWFRGTLALDDALIRRAQRVGPREPLDGWSVGEVASAIRRATEQGVPVRVVVRGRPGSGRATFAAAVAHQLDSTCLAVKAVGKDEPNETWDEVARCALRLSLVGGLVIAWRGLARPVPEYLSLPPVQFVIASVGERVLPARKGAADMAVQIPDLSADQRRDLWRSYVPHGVAWPAAAAERLIGVRSVTVGDIAAVAAAGPQTVEQAERALRARLRLGAGDVGRFVDTQYGWDDLVLAGPTKAALRDVCHEARHRETLRRSGAVRRLYGVGGVVGLFTGPPGTGKTMAAQVIAADLGVDLVMVDLASTVSKYIGETMRNLTRLFADAVANHGGSVMLFDEADALFSSRTDVKDAHDRYANTDTNHLLQLLDGFDGVAILTTNRRLNIDAAFTRRIRHVVEFTRPAADERRQLWRLFIGEIGGPAALEGLSGFVDEMLTPVELSPAQIKSAVLSSCFASDPVGRLEVKGLCAGLERELLKEGRGFTKREKERLARHA